MKKFKTLKLALAALLLGSLAACGGGGGGDGTLRLALTDAPAQQFDAVNVTIEKVLVHQSATAAETDGGWTEIALVGDPVKRDLKTLENGVLAELAETSLPAGHYSQLRLVLADNAVTPMSNSVVPTGEAEVELKTPSAQQTGLKLNVDITIVPGTVADFVLDFDAGKSVVSAGSSGQYLLKPVIRVIAQVGTAPTGVAGFVDTDLTGSAVTLQQSDGTVVGSASPDINGRFKMLSAEGSYTLVVTAPGQATAAVTNVPVTAGFITEVSTDAAPITLLPSSASGTLDGAVTLNDGVNPEGPAVDAMVGVLQNLTSGQTIEVAGGSVSNPDGIYSYAVPVDAPQVAPYVELPAPLVFVPDDAVAGMYSLAPHLDGFADLPEPVGPLAADATINKDFLFVSTP